MKAKNFHLMFIASTSFVFPLFRHKQDRVKLSKQVRHSVQCLFSKRNIYFFVQSLQDEQIPELKTKAKLDSR